MQENKGWLILVDFDDVLVRPLGFAALAVKISSLLHLNLDWFLNKIERIKFIFPVMARAKIGKFIESLGILAPIEDAVEHLLELERDGRLAVVIFTRRTNFLLRLAEILLKDNKLGHINIISAEDKAQALIQIMNDTGGKIIVIDNNLEFIVKAAAMGLDIHGILFSRLRDEGKKALPVDAVVYSWTELILRIREISSH